jgi:hypothetical protein
MDARERRALELDEFRDVPKPSVMDENCSACGCRVGDHWAKLHGNAIGWVGCAVALAHEKAKAS